MIGELGAPLLDFVPSPMLDRAMETTFERHAHDSRWTRVISVVDLPETLTEWGDRAPVAGWCEPVRTMTGPLVAFVVTRFRGRVAFTPVACDAALERGRH